MRRAGDRGMVLIPASTRTEEAQVMVTPKSVVETTPLVVARIKQRERAQRSTERASAPTGPVRRPALRERRRPTGLVSA